MGTIDELYERAQQVSSLLVSCHGCTLCCESGLVYVLEEEQARLEVLNVPLVRIGGVLYIRRVDGGACAMLDKSTRRCSIYEERPFCCRLFPVDVFNRRERVEWGVYDYCPADQQQGAALAVNGSLALSSALTAVRMLEEYLSFDMWKYLKNEDAISREYELLDPYRTRYQLLGDVARADKVVR